MMEEDEITNCDDCGKEVREHELEYVTGGMQVCDDCAINNDYDEDEEE